MDEQIVSFHCILKDRLGRVISSSFNQNVSTGTGDAEGFLPGLARGMRNLKKGERRRILLSAEEAYGFYDPAKVVEVAIEDIQGPETVQLGDVVRLSTAEANYRVTGLTGEVATLDSNHPLAGQDLVFEIEATEVRAPTLEDEDDTTASVIATSSSAIH